jgi:hypothetical protein
MSSKAGGVPPGRVVLPETLPDHVIDVADCAIVQAANDASLIVHALPLQSALTHSRL